MKIINLKNNKMRLLTKEQQGSYENTKTCNIVKKKLKIDVCKIKHIVKLDIITVILGNIEVLHIVYVV